MVNEPAKAAKGRASLSWQTAITVLHDIGAAAASWVLAYELRFNFEVSDFYTGLMFADLVWILPIQAFVCWRAGMYRGLWRYASLTDLRRASRRMPGWAGSRPGRRTSTPCRSPKPRS